MSERAIHLIMQRMGVDRNQAIRIYKGTAAATRQPRGFSRKGHDSFTTPKVSYSGVSARY